MRSPVRTSVGALLALILVATACSGGGATGRDDIQAIAPNEGTASGEPFPPGGSGVPTAAPASGLPTPGTSVGTLPPTSGGGNPGGTKPGGATPTVRPSTYAIPNLFTPSENTVGLTKDKIVLCAHAALSLAAVFNVNAEDLNVYWQYVNEELGGIYGRRVEISYTDDNYGNTPDDVKEAYEDCKAKKPFVLLGGIGFDQIPQVRSFAERDHQLYIHHIAREDFAKKYSFSYLPSVETAGRLAAQWILREHAANARNIGVIYRDSAHWEPGHKTFKTEVERRGYRLAADVPVQKSASVYSVQIKALQDANAKVVFVWENALSAMEIVEQARRQGYNPQWLVFPFNIMTDTLQDSTTSPIPVEGIAMWPAYRPGDTSGSYASYADEIRMFEAKHQQYGKGAKDDVVWMTWLAWHQLHQLLLDCGPDCTRNKIAGLLQSGVHKPIRVLQSCAFDFTRNGHVGGFKVNIFEAEMKNDKAGWKNIQLCRDGF